MLPFVDSKAKAYFVVPSSDWNFIDCCWIAPRTIADASIARIPNFTIDEKAYSCGSNSTISSSLENINYSDDYFPKELLSTSIVWRSLTA